MHPAFSVIFFSTLSGLGYGLIAWSSLLLGIGWRDALAGKTPMMFFVALLAATLLVTVGLLSSLGHLGKPQRAWRAFSQWRTSWLSREGVAAVPTYLPVLVLLATLSSPWWPDGAGERFAPGNALPWFALVAVVAGFAGAAATVVCTAMIYASLKPIPAWRHRFVLPVYLLFALLTGGLPLAALLALHASATAIAGMALVLLLLATLLVVLKRRYWRDVDADVAAPADRASALGLPADRVATVFERPHTEANYLTKEMGFVVARRHAAKLRRIALVLFGFVPLLAAVMALLWPPVASVVFAVAAAAALVGAVVERWLFFAQARHLVTLYY
ncbi:dimethyl sulfoxide reductase anchor subunit family protein [Arenimonas composti]|uniref:DMSO reductase n=1 Tax=Arenimonas composti TR7-09 = DSM 18010 TaxID=1121013 RepID=A0A091BGP8_9GAMM|nr:DmsC/YnfH family molybdoenzyme membrane anchor subunit [Arenimonas composti]KFN49939.1 hypothetical protein P873_08835 [Arenimonas composti TR7-09 = DSM 18010]